MEEVELDAGMLEVPERLFVENLEIILLVFIVAVAVLFNSLVFAQLVSSARAPTVRTNFLTGHYQNNSFALFKLNLCISDFFILLIYALGKISWLVTFEWKLGNSGCKVYKFFSSFSFYANTNIIVAIALDRLKVVYTTQIQGPTSVRRVKIMVCASWIAAFVCSQPQFVIWRTIKVGPNWNQCVTIFTIHNFLNTTTESMEQSALYYEVVHQLTVFWAPLCIIVISYLLIVVKLLHYSLKTRERIKIARYVELEQRLQKAESSPLGTCLRPLSVGGINLRSRSSCEISLEVLHRKKKLNKPTGVTLHRTTSWPTWRCQLGSRVFRRAFMIIAAHITLWLPYNTISALRFNDEELYAVVMTNGGNFLEDLIIVNSLLNPLLYADRRRSR